MAPLDRIPTAQRDALAKHISNDLLQRLRIEVLALGRDFGREWDLDEHLVSVLAATLLREGVDVLRNWEAGEAEAAGLLAKDIGIAAETGVSNYRRNLPHAAEFREARKNVEATGKEVFVGDGPFRVQLNP